MTPQGLVKVMNHYLTRMSEPIRKHQGIIDKYIGDAIMAYWGPPFIDEADQARLACLAALDMVRSVAAVQKELPELLGMRSIPMELEIRIGIATGEAAGRQHRFRVHDELHGDGRHGEPCLATRARQQGLRQSRDGLGSDRLRRGGRDRAARDRPLFVAGQSQAQTLFEIMGVKGALSEPQAQLRSRYAEGLAAYRARRFDDARASFNAALGAVPGDGPAMAFLQRDRRPASQSAAAGLGRRLAPGRQISCACC